MMRPDFDFNAGVMRECESCGRYHSDDDAMCMDCRMDVSKRGEWLYMVATVVAAGCIVWMFKPYLLECLQMWLGGGQ